MKPITPLRRFPKCNRYRALHDRFNFQAPTLYRSLGYAIAYEHAPYPHGIVKLVMVKRDPA